MGQFSPSFPLSLAVVCPTATQGSRSNHQTYRSEGRPIAVRSCTSRHVRIPSAGTLMRTRLVASDLHLDSNLLPAMTIPERGQFPYTHQSSGCRELVCASRPTDSRFGNTSLFLRSISPQFTKKSKPSSQRKCASRIMFILPMSVASKAGTRWGIVSRTNLKEADTTSLFWLRPLALCPFSS